MSAHPSIVPQQLLLYINSKQDCRYLRLPHPRTGLPALFLPYARSADLPSSTSKTRILEVQSIAPDARRSWFLSQGEVISDGKLVVLVPIDPAFLLITLLGYLSDSEAATRFLPLPDLLEETAVAIERQEDTEPAAAAAFSSLVELADLDCIQHAMRRVCDVKEPAPGLEVYRFAPSHALDLLRTKVANVARQETFQGFPTLQRSLAKDGLVSAPALEGQPESALHSEARVRAACEVISHYISPLWTEKLLASYDFTLLDGHLKTLADEASAALPPAPDKSKLKDATNAPGNKKRKTTSQGVEKLKKADVSGMAKLSTFFMKK